MKTTTIKLTGGILGSEKMMVRCQLANAAAPVEVDYCEGEGWQGTQYQAGDARHSADGLAKIGIELAQSAVHEQGTCDWGEYEPTYAVADFNNKDTGLSFGEAVERIAEWYEDMDQWATGTGSDEEHAAIAEAIASIDQPTSGGAKKLQSYANDVCEAVAEAVGSKSFAGHGNYYVSAADRIGCQLTVTEDE